MNIACQLPETNQAGIRCVQPAWLKNLAHLEYAFQPIVNIHTGVCLGYETSLQTFRSLGFPLAADLFELAWQEGCIGLLDSTLCSAMLRRLRQQAWRGETKIFYQLDLRVLRENDAYLDSLRRMVGECQIQPDAICLEVVEREPVDESLLEKLAGLRHHGFRLALADCGNDFTGLRLLWSLEPDFIKINRYFIRDLLTHSRKRTLLACVIGIAHSLGCQVIAEGVENEKEYYLCKDLGCDLLQGPLVQTPVTELDQLRDHHLSVLALAENDRRRKNGEDLNLLQTRMENIPTVDPGTDIFEIFQKFKDQKQRTLFVAVNAQHEPVGILHEKSFKEYAYSRFGNQLLQNPARRGQLGAFLSKCPIADIHTPVEAILEMYSQNDSIEGVVIVENARYVGFLSAQSLLKVLYEKNLALARDQNPLSKLPGNNLITDYVNRALQDVENQYLLVYFDFDYFKPYNDCYGFRNGDRVILLFTGLLQAFQNRCAAFIGHIGGDDFFAGLKNASLAEHGEMVGLLAAKFRSDVESFYDPETVQQGCLQAQDREGKYRKFPLLSVSAVVLELKPGRKPATPAEIGRLLAQEKRTAKGGKNGHVRLISLGDARPEIFG